MHPQKEGEREADTYIDAEHSLHFKVTQTRVENERKRWRGKVADRTHDAEREETDGGRGYDGARGLLRVDVQGVKNAAPGVNATETEHAGIDPRAQIIRQPMFVRMEDIDQAVLQHVEDEETGETNRDRCEGAEHRLVGVDVKVAELPGTTPVTDHRRCDHQRGEYRVQDRQDGVVQTIRGSPVQASGHPGTSRAQLDHSHPIRIEFNSRTAGHSAWFALSKSLTIT